MADTQQPNATEAVAPGAAVTQAVADETQQGTQTTTQTETAESLKAEIARLEKLVRDTNKENAARRKKLEEFEKSEQERAQAAMSETDKLKAQVSEFQKAVEKAQADNERFKAELAAEMLKNAVIGKAAEMGFANPADAFALADLAGVENTDGKYRGIEEALGPLKSRLPMRGGGSQKPVVPQLGAMNPPVADAPQETDDQRRARLFGQHGNFFDAKAAAAQGGGVLMSPQNPKQNPAMQ